jgi:sterol desaturase/sphingolipid hydroxylase (fatty acid hydroxylase superfamily)
MWSKLELLYGYTNPVLYILPGFAFMIALEWLIDHDRHPERFDLKESLASISMGVGVVFFDLIGKGWAFLAYSFLWVWSKDWHLITDATPLWAVLPLLLLADDFSFYWHHRICHEVRLLWAAHVQHHSSEQYNLAIALRQSWTEILFKYAFWLWLPLVGFTPLMIFSMMAVSLVYQYWVHTQVVGSLPRWFELFFNTPSHHRVHHASNVRYLDMNYAGILIVWDRLFGTFAPEDPREPVVYGITTNIRTHNPLRIATHEYAALWKDLRRAPDWKARWGYLFKRPGWSHDGRTLTAPEMRKRLSERV